MAKVFALFLLALLAISMLHTTVLASHGHGGHHYDQKNYGPGSLKSFPNMRRGAHDFLHFLSPAKPPSNHGCRNLQKFPPNCSPIMPLNKCSNYHSQNDLTVVKTQPSSKTPPKIKRECPSQCSRRCGKTQYHKPCMFFCQKCCKKCLCVPPGYYGNKAVCPCYNNWKTKEGGPKCP